jgi:hypothetical protein
MAGRRGGRRVRGRGLLGEGMFVRGPSTDRLFHLLLTSFTHNLWLSQPPRSQPLG